MNQPKLPTGRLVLRPFTFDDAEDVQRLAGDVRIARGTDSVPHPYPRDAAVSWIGSHRASFESMKEIVYAITLRAGGTLVGAISLLNISARDRRAELGFWVGVEHWSNGYCTEAAKILMAHAHEKYGISRIVGRCMAWNTASAKVMGNLGLKLEGRLHGHVLREDRFEDQLVFGLRRQER